MWDATASGLAVDEIQQKMREAVDATLDTNEFNSWDDDVATQQDYAIEKAWEIAGNTDLGDGPFTVTVGGHRKRDDDPEGSYIHVHVKSET